MKIREDRCIKDLTGIFFLTAYQHFAGHLKQEHSFWLQETFEDNNYFTDANITNHSWAW